MITRLHPVTRLAALAVFVTALAGCQGVTGIQPISQVRVIDASPDAPALDIYQNSNASLYSIGFGTATSYIPITAGAYTHAAYTAGTQQQLAAIHAAFASGGQYTVLTGNIAANLQMSVLKDQSYPAPTGQVALRFVDQATRAGAVDLYLLPAGFSLTGIAPIATGLNFGGNTGYVSAPAGTYSVVVFPTGAAPSATTPAFTGSQVTYPGTSARTIVLIDQAPTQQTTPHGLQTIIATDYDAASSASSLLNPFAQK